MRESAYAKAGVDYTKIEPFKHLMGKYGKQTLGFPDRHHVEVRSAEHGAVFRYRGMRRHSWCSVLEGLGNLNWIAEWMYMNTGASYYDVIARAAALIIAIDVIAQGARPVLWEDGVSAGDSEWFSDMVRANDYGQGALDVCRELGMALPAGESPSLKYIINAKPPVKSCPDLMGTITGIIFESQEIRPQRMKSGDRILVAPSTGLGANGISLVIKEALAVPDQFMTVIPETGRSLGEEALIPIRSYAALMEALLDDEVEIHNVVPGTGDGVGKLAFDKRDFTYRIHSWVPVPPLFNFMRNERQIPLLDCMKTFNWGAGMYFILPCNEVVHAMDVASKLGYALAEVGEVEDGPRQTIFEPEDNLILPPPGE